MPRRTSISRNLPATASLLLVDDNHSDCQSIAKWIAESGLPWRLTTASSLAEVQEIATTDTFDIFIVADGLMDGCALDLLPDFDDTRLIVLIRGGSEQAAAEVLRLRCSQFLVKDSGGGYLQLLQAAVNRVLEHHWSRPETESDGRYRSVFNAMTEGFALHEIVCDENGRPCDYRFLDVNPAFERLTGLRRDDIVGHLKRAAIPGEDEFWIQTYGAVALGGPPVSFEHRSSLSGRFWRVYAYSPAPGQFAALFSDITERKRAEEELKKAHDALENRVLKRTLELSAANQQLQRDIVHRERLEQRFRATFDAAPTAMLMVNRAGAIVLVNAQTEFLFGYGRDGLVGQPVEVLLPKRFQTLHPDLRAAFFQSPTARRMGAGRDLFGLRKDGLEFPIEIGLNPVETDEGLCVLSAIVDLTERIRTEEQVQRHQAELAHVARLSTMGEMATGLAHEINQPLCAINNYAQGCIHRIESSEFRAEELRDALGQVVSEAERAAEIIRRLRNFVTKRGPHRSSVDINELIRNVIQLSAAELRERQVHVEFQLADGLALLLADSIQIQQVVLNLVRNGFEALDSIATSRVLTVTSRRDADKNVEVVIRDNGRGLPAADMEKVFEPFFTTKPYGLGMGLSISRSIIESHGGRLWANSVIRGAEFHFMLPLPAEDAQHA